MQLIIDDQRLDQLAGFINEMPTKYGFGPAVLLNQWIQEAKTAEIQKPCADAAPASE